MRVRKGEIYDDSYLRIGFDDNSSVLIDGAGRIHYAVPAPVLYEKGDISWLDHYVLEGRVINNFSRIVWITPGLISEAILDVIANDEVAKQWKEKSWDPYITGERKT
jgi:hypothetical protein